MRALGAGDADLGFLLSMCEALSGDTVQLPRKVNIGSDQVIDRLRSILATETLSPMAGAFSRAGRARDDAARAQQAVLDYVLRELGKAELDTVTCSKCYVDAYHTAVLDIDDSTRDVIHAECLALGLPPAGFLD